MRSPRPLSARVRRHELMTTLRVTAIMKTDISGSTARFRTLLEPDLTTLLAEHRELLGRVAAAHDGRIVKPEGDGFWLAFPSVTAGALGRDGHARGVAPCRGVQG